MRKYNVAFIGCGYVSSFYALTISNHPNIQLAGVFDINRERAEKFIENFPTKIYSSYQDILLDKNIDIVANLTDISNHYEVSKNALKQGKHVYSEKPIAETIDQAYDLIVTSKQHNVQLSVAPCNLLSASSQAIANILKSKSLIGPIRLVYANIDDGPIYKMDYQSWISKTGVPWPHKEEFQMGCVREHAEYYIGLLCSFFGSATEVCSMTYRLIDSNLYHGKSGTDFSVSCIRFENGTLARLNCCSMIPGDRSISIFCEKAVIRMQDCWDYNSDVWVQKYTFSNPREGRNQHLSLTVPKKVSLLEELYFHSPYLDSHQMDFSRGISEIAQSIEKGKNSLLNAQNALHILEVIEAIENTKEDIHKTIISSKFHRMQPYTRITRVAECIT
ncbi:MAG TPA: Gfo/Idh/MocA family oxidoreductase [Candidatus Rhabdochlamydia sp.]|jgi:predicted dehydrogenase|nr:Gfo/Idh/MocA family oxidoreductase [Candidatus Rhabdochlamydia sp.]